MRHAIEANARQPRYPRALAGCWGLPERGGCPELRVVAGLGAALIARKAGEAGGHLPAGCLEVDVAQRDRGCVVEESTDERAVVSTKPPVGPNGPLNPVPRTVSPEGQVAWNPFGSTS